MEAVRVMSDLAHSVAAGQNLIKAFTPVPPPVQFYNIRLGLGSAQNTSVETLPSIIATDIANTQFFATFDGPISGSAVPGQNYKDIPITLPGPRGGSQRRVSDTEAGEVTMQTSSPSNGFGLKSVIFRGGSEALCVSNIIIKGSKTQASNEDIFIPIGDLGFLCGHKWSWGSVLEGNRQRCIWLDGRSDSESSSFGSLHIDIKKMADVLKIDKEDKLTNTDLDNLCLFFSNNIPPTIDNTYNSEPISAKEGGIDFGLSESENVLSDQSNMEELLGETISLTQSLLHEEVQGDLAVGEMQTEELFSNKPVALGDQNMVGMMTDDQDLMGELSIEKQAVLNREEEFLIMKAIAEETLKSEEIEAEENLFAQQKMEEELLMKNEELAEQALAEEKQKLSLEEGLIMEQALAINELAAEEELAEKILFQEESLAEEEIVAEIDLAEQIFEEEKEIAEERFIVEKIAAEQKVSELFRDGEMSEEGLQAEMELLDAEISAEEEQLLIQQDTAKLVLEELKLSAVEGLEKDMIQAEIELEENEKLAEEELVGDVASTLFIVDQNKQSQIFTEQETEEDLEDWVEEQDVFDELADGQSFEDLSYEPFSDVESIGALDAELSYPFEEGMSDGFASDSDTENQMNEVNNGGKLPSRVELRKRMAFYG